MLERFFTSMVKPKEVFKYKEDSGSKSFLFFSLIIVLYTALMTLGFRLNGGGFIKTFLQDATKDALSVVIFVNFLIAVFSVFFQTLFYTIIIFLFSTNKEKTFGLFFKINLYILGTVGVIGSAISVLFPALELLITPVVFILVIVYLFLAYGGAKDY